MKNNTIVDNQSNKIQLREDYDMNKCPLTAIMRVIGGKWKLILLNMIYLDSPARFGALRRKASGITQTMLTTMLRELEDDGIIHRKVYAEVPPKVEYTLTELGMSLLPIVQMMKDWGKEHCMDGEVR
jgi:DNA-binding HxlR family transcriptional regulator